MPTKPKPTVKLPKGRVLYALPIPFPTAPAPTFWDCADGFAMLPVAVLPCRTRQEARQIVRLHSESPQKLIFTVMNAMDKRRGWESQSLAESVLQSLHLIP